VFPSVDLQDHQTGYQLPFVKGKPPLRASPPFTPPCVDKVKVEAIDKGVLSLLALAAMEVITDSNPVFYGSC
jgi:hypothetical protein